KLAITQTMIAEQMTSLTSMCELACQIVQKKLEEKQLEEEQAAKAQNWKLPVCYDDDDDEESSKSLEDDIISELPPYFAVTPSEPVDSLNMGNEHLNTILATKSDEFIKSCVENLVPNPNLFEPFFNEKINPMKIDQHSFNAESDLIESMPNNDSSIIISLKIDSLFDEFAGGLTLLKSILPGIDETDCHPEKETRFAKRLLYDNSSPRPLEEIVFDNSNADIESFSPSPIPNKDSGSHMEEIDYHLLRMTQCRQALRMMIMTLEGIFRSLKNCLTIIPFHSLPMSHTILIFLHLVVLLQNHQMEKSPGLLSHLGLEAFQPSAECPMIINGKNIP
nr:hypothetical protein [Tanacetum cinerariifolium]